MAYEVSERRACQVTGFPRASHRYQSVLNDRAELRIRLRDLAASRAHYGYRRLHILLQREGWKVNHKLVYRVYKEEGLAMLRKKPRRNRSCQIRESRQVPEAPNERWSMDFMSDQLFCGKRFRILTLVDNFSRVSLAAHAGRRLTGDHVVEVLEKVSKRVGFPKVIQVDNGPEFISKSLDWWAYWNKVKLDFSRPGKPTDNAAIKSFNGRLRKECLNENWFLSLEDAQEKLKLWREDYNHVRPPQQPRAVDPSRIYGQSLPSGFGYASAYGQ